MVKSILSLVFALTLFMGAGLMLATTQDSVVSVVYASSSDSSSSDSSGLSAGDACTCGALPGVWVVSSSSDSSSSDSSSSDSSSSDSSSSDSSSSDSSGYCDCKGFGAAPGAAGAPPATFQPF